MLLDMHKRSFQVLMLAGLLSSSLLASSGCGAAYGLALTVAEADWFIRDRHYFSDLPLDFVLYDLYDGYWHNGYCWYDDRWCYQGRGTPFSDPYYRY